MEIKCPICQTIIETKANFGATYCPKCEKSIVFDRNIFNEHQRKKYQAIKQGLWKHKPITIVLTCPKCGYIWQSCSIKGASRCSKCGNSVVYDAEKKREYERNYRRIKSAEKKRVKYDLSKKIICPTCNRVILLKGNGPICGFVNCIKCHRKIITDRAVYSKYRRDVRLKHLQEENQRTRKFYLKAKLAAIQKFGGKCVLCGCSDAVVLVFHHRDRKRESSMDWVKYDSSKLALVCANCHQRIHHYLDKGVDILNSKEPSTLAVT